MTTMLKCYCGEEPAVETISDISWVGCNCGVSGPVCETEEKAVEAWERMFAIRSRLENVARNRIAKLKTELERCAVNRDWRACLIVEGALNEARRMLMEVL